MEFEKNPTGIYRIEENGKLTPLIPADVNKETVLHMETFQGKPIVVVEENGYLYGKAYSSEGALLGEFQFSFDLRNTSRVMLLSEKGHVLFVQEPVYGGNNRDLSTYGMEQEQFKQIDHMPLDGLNIMDISGGYMNTLLRYKKDTGTLYIAVNDDGKALRIAAQTNKKPLYRSTSLGDHTDDSKLALPDVTQITAGNTYESIMSYISNTQKRTLQNLRFVWDGDV